MITRKQRSVISILAALCTTGYTLNHQAFAQGSAPPTAIPASQKNHAVQENIGWAPVKYTGKHITALGGYKLTVPFNVSPGNQVAARAYIQAYVPQDGLILFFLFFQSTSERSLVNNIRNNPASFIGLPANAFKITKNAYSDTTQYNGNWLDFIHIVANGKETRFTFSGNNAFKGPPPAAWLGRENPTFGQPRMLSVLISSRATVKSLKGRN